MQSSQSHLTDSASPMDANKWPDFYAILDAKVGADDKGLRDAINQCYMEANSKIDHRDLAVRFYNQILTQKVLPACRRILLDPEMRNIYDEQLKLHRDNAPGMISYQKFVVEITRTKTSCLLNEDELSILPSVDSAEVASSLNVLKPLVKKGSLSETETVTVRTTTSSESVSTQAAPTKKGLPLMALGGVGALLLLGAGAFFMTRPPEPEAGGTKSAVAAAAISDTEETAVKKSNAPVYVTAPLMKFESLLGNADFEEVAPAPWVIHSSRGAKTKNDEMPKSGGRVLNFWTAKKTEKARVSQQVSNLAPGKYALKAWIKRSGSQREAYMFASGYGGPTVKIDMPKDKGEVWQQVSLKDINVTNGTCTIGFYINNVANNPVDVDVIEFNPQ